MRVIRTLDRLLFGAPTSAGVREAALDGVRGIAVLFVIGGHMTHSGLHLIPGYSLRGVGKVGVWLFFVLSSFLLTTQLLARDRDRFWEAWPWANYFVRRFLRIVPLYVIVLLTSWAFRDTAHFVFLTGDELVDHLLLRAGKNLFWTIPVEFKYYFVLPVVAFVCVVLLRNRAILVVPTAVLAILAVRASTSAHEMHWLYPFLPIFFCGSLAAFVHAKIGPRRAPLWVRVLCEVTALICLTIAVLMTPSVASALTGQTLWHGYYHQYYTFFGVLWGVFVISMLRAEGPLRRILASRPLRLLGVISFSAYLWHIPVIHYVQMHAGVHPPLLTPIVFAAIVAFSTLSYLVIERPLQQVRLRRAIAADERGSREAAD